MIGTAPLESFGCVQLYGAYAHSIATFKTFFSPDSAAASLDVLSPAALVCSAGAAVVAAVLLPPHAVNAPAAIIPANARLIVLITFLFIIVLSFLPVI